MMFWKGVGSGNFSAIKVRMTLVDHLAVHDLGNKLQDQGSQHPFVRMIQAAFNP
jgi:hypothetical protein